MAFDLNALVIGRLYTRPELAQLWGYASYRAIGKGVFTPRTGGYIVLFVTRQKQKSLPQYQDFLSGDYLHWEGEKAHGNDRRVANAHRVGEEIHLFYRDIHHTPFRYHGPLQLINFQFEAEKPSRAIFRLVHDLSAGDDLKTRETELLAVPETERERLVKARIGQGDFREAVLSYWKRCAITDIPNADLLRASHIKPWRESSNSERLDPYNGLLLLPQYDHLFDRGYITFDDRGVLIPSPAIETLPQDRLGIDFRARLRHVEKEHHPFLEFHRAEVFWSKSGTD